jgi:hypothetical protein
MKILIAMTTIRPPNNIVSIKENIDYLLSKYPDYKAECLIVLDNVDNTKIINKIKSLDDNFSILKPIVPSEQIKWLKSIICRKIRAGIHVQNLNQIIPDNSVQRRNFATLYAIFNQFDIMISIDDDNEPLDNTWLDSMVHNQTTYKTEFEPEFYGWFDFFNNRILLPDKKNYAHTRGMLINRSKTDNHQHYSDTDGELVVLQGYTLGDPDRSAIDRLLNPDLIIEKEDIYLPNNTWTRTAWTPFNTQNTLFYKKCFPALFLYPMNNKAVHYSKIDRVDDILMSFIVQKIAHHFGDFIGFGNPFTYQKRIGHSLISDSRGEWAGLLFLEAFMDLLYKIKVSGNDYLEAFESVTTGLYNFLVKGRLPYDFILLDCMRRMKFWYQFVRILTEESNNDRVE